MKAALAACAALALAPAGPPCASRSFLQGAWANPSSSVEIRIAPCGPALCGQVIAASATAISDARDSGFPGLIGMTVLRDYSPDGRGQWRGTVFVPDLGHTVSSHIVAVDPDHVRVSGCLIGRFLCKSQLWHRA